MATARRGSVLRSPLRTLTCWPLYLAVERASVRTAVHRDIMHATTGQMGAIPDRTLIVHAMSSPGVRTVFYERLHWGTAGERRLVKLLRRIWREMPSAELSCGQIGGGFVLAHGQSTVIRAESIGRDCRIFQQVTVGAIHGRYPRIGDRVTIYPGAKVLGGITIGQDAVVGPNALVQTDVPPEAVMVAPRAQALADAVTR